MEQEGHRDSVFHRFVTVCDSVYMHICVHMYCLPMEWAKSAVVLVSLAEGGVDFVSICIFGSAQNTSYAMLLKAGQWFLTYKESKYMNLNSFRPSFWKVMVSF